MRLMRFVTMMLLGCFAFVLVIAIVVIIQGAFFHG